jgi:hypothetical protein
LSPFSYYAANPQLQHHRPYRPRQVHPGGPPHPVDRHGGGPPVQEQHHTRGGVMMNKLAAFIGHSFTENDKEAVDKFLEFFNTIRDMEIGFSWGHAENAEPKILSAKVKEKMQGKNCFIGICTSKEFAIEPDKLELNGEVEGILNAKQESLEYKTSDWIIQEIGFALGLGMPIILLLEEGLRRPGGLQGDLEHIPFNRQTLEKSFRIILQMITSLIPRAVQSLGSAVDRPIEQEPAKEENVEKEAEVLEPSDGWGYWDYRWALFNYILTDNIEKQKEIFEKYLETEAGKDDYNKIKWGVDRLYLLQFFKKEDNMQEIVRTY